jgi:hypothetical protein
VRRLAYRPTGVQTTAGPPGARRSPLPEAEPLRDFAPGLVRYGAGVDRLAGGISGLRGLRRVGMPRASPAAAHWCPSLALLVAQASPPWPPTLYAHRGARTGAMAEVGAAPGPAAGSGGSGGPGAATVPIMSLSDLAGPACGGRTTRLDK